MKCRHCDHRKACAPRGLCNVCWADRATRERYPAQTQLQVAARRYGAPTDPCRHCAVRQRARGSRGLCRLCTETPEVSALYPAAPRVRENPTICRCCQQSKANRPRGLCWQCYYTPGVLDRFPPTSRFAWNNPSRGDRDDRPETGTDPPAEPTDHPPGSPGKVEVLTRRFAARTSLWHPDDA